VVRSIEDDRHPARQRMSHARRQVLVALLRQVEDAHREAVLAIIEVHLEVVGGDGAPLVLVVLDLVLAEILGPRRAGQRSRKQDEMGGRHGSSPPRYLSSSGEPAMPVAQESSWHAAGTWQPAMRMPSRESRATGARARAISSVFPAGFQVDVEVGDGGGRRGG